MSWFLRREACEGVSRGKLNKSGKSGSRTEGRTGDVPVPRERVLGVGTLGRQSPGTCKKGKGDVLSLSRPTQGPKVVYRGSREHVQCVSTHLLPTSDSTTLGFWIVTVDQVVGSLEPCLVLPPSPSSGRPDPRERNFGVRDRRGVE